MTKITNQKFENVVVNLDGYEYRDCQFVNCQMVFTGMAPHNIFNCNLVGTCAWSFAGPAQATLNFLNGLYKASPEQKALAEMVIAGIRNGATAPQPSVIQPIGSPDKSVN